MSQQLSGKTAIVSGAANGIGLAVARRFLEAGANVMLTDIDEDKLEAETKALEAPEKAQFFPGDLRKKLTIANFGSGSRPASATGLLGQLCCSGPINSVTCSRPVQS